MRNLLKASLLATTLLLTSCTGIPEGLTPVQPFELKRYLGEWHEIARLDHRFERGLTEVTANYSMRDDGGVRVINHGFNSEDNAWQQAEGKVHVSDESEHSFRSNPITHFGLIRSPISVLSDHF